MAIDLDNRIRPRRAEKARETGKTSIPVPKASTSTAKPFSLARDPNAMDIDATRTREDFLKHMSGKCFACGGTNHSKRDCNQVGSLCSHCGRVGHKETVCESKFCGKPKKVVIRSATIEEVAEDASSTATQASSSALEAQIAALLDSQKLLTAQIDAMKKAF